MAEKLKVASVLALIFGAYGLMGTLDYEEELRQEQHYCQMVRDGAWPNYKPEINCGVHN